ncbi:hypothetical protein IF2G_03421 [Cordyceps javanica]|nr:hypothetical protein IF2G_03421 [Cordyceps javanica]
MAFGKRESNGESRSYLLPTVPSLRIYCNFRWRRANFPWLTLGQATPDRGHGSTIWLVELAASHCSKRRNKASSDEQAQAVICTRITTIGLVRIYLIVAAKTKSAFRIAPFPWTNYLLVCDGPVDQSQLASPCHH